MGTKCSHLLFLSHNLKFKKLLSAILMRQLIHAHTTHDSNPAIQPSTHYCAQWRCGQTRRMALASATVRTRHIRCQFVNWRERMHWFDENAWLLFEMFNVNWNWKWLLTTCWPLNIVFCQMLGIPQQHALHVPHIGMV